VAARARVEPTTLRLRVININLTNAPPHPTTLAHVILALSMELINYLTVRSLMRYDIGFAPNEDLLYLLEYIWMFAMDDAVLQCSVHLFCIKCFEMLYHNKVVFSGVSLGMRLVTLLLIHKFIIKIISFFYFNADIYFDGS